MEATEITEARTARGPAPARSRRDAVLAAAWRVLPYVVIAVIPIALRAPWFGVPFVQDEGVYMTIGMGMRHGIAPYQGIFDNKTPLIYVVYLFSYVVGGGVYTPRVLAAISLGLTGLCVVGIGREFGWARWQSISAGIIFGFSTSNIVLESNANTEVFTILPMTASLFAVLRGERLGGRRWYVLAGVFAGASILFKTSAAPTAVVLFMYLLLSHRARAMPWATFAAFAALPLVASVIALAAWRALPATIYANYTFNQSYFGSPPFLHHPRELWTMPTRVFDGGVVFWVLAAAGTAAVFARRVRADILVLSWAVASWLAVKATGRDYDHYYVQLLPSIALLAIITVRALPPMRFVRLGTCAVIVLLAVLQVDLYASIAAPGSQHASYTGVRPCESQSQAIGAWARTHTSSSDRIYNVGRNAEIYFYANRLPAARFMYDRAFPVDASAINETLVSLEKTRPALVIDTLSNSCPLPYTFPPQIAAFVAQNYTLVTTIGDAKMYELNTRVDSSRVRANLTPGLFP